MVDIKNYAKLAGIVNPQNRSLDVYNEGAGGDLAISVLVTNSDCFVHSDVTRLGEGYFGGAHTIRMRKEAEKLGINNLGIDDQGDQATITFGFQHPQDVKLRPRELKFYAADVFQFFPSDFRDGYDVLIATGEAPKFIGHDCQMRQLGTMRAGGHFISDRDIARHLKPEMIGFQEIPNGVEFPCGPARVYRKVDQVDPDRLSKLFHLDDQVADLLGFVMGGHPYTTLGQIEPEDAARTARKIDPSVNMDEVKDDWRKWQHNIREDFYLKGEEKGASISRLLEQLPPNISGHFLDKLAQEHPPTFDNLQRFTGGR